MNDYTRFLRVPSVMITINLLMVMMMNLARIIGATNLAGGYDVITSTTIEIDSLYICDPSDGDPEIFVRVNVDGSSWETSTIEATENYETLIWSGETHTYNYEVEDVTLKIYDDDWLAGNELRGSVTYNIADDLFTDDGDGSNWITRTFYKPIYFNDDNCYEYLTFTISFDGYYYESNTTPEPVSNINPNSNTGSDSGNDNGDSKDPVLNSIHIILIIVGVVIVLCLIACTYCVSKCSSPCS